MGCVHALGAVCDPNGHTTALVCPRGHPNGPKLTVQRIHLGRRVGDALTPAPKCTGQTLTLTTNFFGRLVVGTRKLS
jgi:hypothetical protein